MNLMYINWNPDPIIFSLGGFSLRWYSVFWGHCHSIGQHRGAQDFPKEKDV